MPAKQAGLNAMTSRIPAQMLMRAAVLTVLLDTAAAAPPFVGNLPEMPVGQSTGAAGAENKPSNAMTTPTKRPRTPIARQAAQKPEESRQDRDRRILREKAEAGSAEAALELANQFLWGNDPAEARPWLLQAAASIPLASVVLHGLDHQVARRARLDEKVPNLTPSSEEIKALDAMRALAALGSVEARWWLAWHEFDIAKDDNKYATNNKTWQAYANQVVAILGTHADPAPWQNYALASTTACRDLVTKVESTPACLTALQALPPAVTDARLLQALLKITRGETEEVRRQGHDDARRAQFNFYGNEYRPMYRQASHLLAAADWQYGDSAAKAKARDALDNNIRRYATSYTATTALQDFPNGNPCGFRFKDGWYSTTSRVMFGAGGGPFNGIRYPAPKDNDKITAEELENCKIQAQAGDAAAAVWLAFLYDGHWGVTSDAKVSLTYLLAALGKEPFADWLLLYRDPDASLATQAIDAARRIAERHKGSWSNDLPYLEWRIRGQKADAATAERLAADARRVLRQDENEQTAMLLLAQLMESKLISEQYPDERIALIQRYLRVKDARDQWLLPTELPEFLQIPLRLTRVNRIDPYQAQLFAYSTCGHWKSGHKYCS